MSVILKHPIFYVKEVPGCVEKLSWPLKHPWLRERASSSFLNSDQSPVLNKETEQKAGSRPVSQRLWISSSLPKGVTLAWEPRSRTWGTSPPLGTGIGPAFPGVCCLKTGPYCSVHTCHADALYLLKGCSSRWSATPCLPPVFEGEVHLLLLPTY